MSYSSISNEIIKCIRDVVNSDLNNKEITLHEPYFSETNALKYVKDCIDSGWVSTSGRWIQEFEEQICNYTGAKYAIALSNGTVALRLALRLIGLKNNEEVIIPPISFIATANAVSHLGGIPHFVDIEKETLGLCPLALTQRLEECAEYKNDQLINKFTNRRIAAIVPVHVFGHPANCPLLKNIADKWNIPLIEDTAEALGSWRTTKSKKIHCGLFGDIGTLSFNGNKLITTGGGGALITNNEKLANLARHLSTTARRKHEWEIEHDFVGWNDRLPSINAALGVSQMEVLTKRLKKKNKLAIKYSNIFKGKNFVEIIKSPDNCESNYWLNSIRLKFEDKEKLFNQRNNLLRLSHNNKILLRPLWRLLSKQTIYKECPRGSLNNAENEEFRIISLPSSPQLIR